MKRLRTIIVGLIIVATAGLLLQCGDAADLLGSVEERVAEAATYDLTVLVGSGGSIVAPGSSMVTVGHGSSTSIEASPDSDFTFIEWIVENGSATISDPNSKATTIILTAGDATIRATFVDSQAPDPPNELDLASEDDTGSSSIDNITNQMTNLTFTGTADSLSMIELFSSHDGSVGTVAVDGSGNWTIDCSLSPKTSAHAVTAKATDEFGNTSLASDALDVVVDTTPPSPPTLTSFHSDDFNEITVIWTNSPGVYENRLWWTPEDGDGPLVLDNSYESITVNNLVDGTFYDFSIVAIDVAGNESNPDTMPTIAPEEGMKRWDFDNGDYNDSTTPAIGSDGTIYVGSWDGVLYALDPADGSIRWTFTAGDNILGAPTTTETGVIYVTSWDGYVYAINSDTHTYNWRFDTGSRVDHGVAIDNMQDLWVGSGSTLYKLSDTSGSELWSYSVTGTIATTPVVGNNGKVYVGVEAGSSIKVYAFEEGENTIVYSNSNIDSIYTDFAIDDQGSLYFGTSGGLVKIGSDSSLRWVFEPDSNVPAIESPPVIGTDGTVFVGSRIDHLYALDPSDGSIKWSHNTIDDADGGPVVGANGTVYAVGNEDGLYALNAMTGAVQWYKTWGVVGESRGVSSILLENGTLLVPDTGLSNTGLTAIWTRSGGPATSPWPMYGYDMLNSFRVPD